ncbi:MAG TPA: hypothetical protein VK858_19715 [Longimicrobiales bacterium]|nr:hypothetical protein [Longimicrobiales bacterium]
MRTGKRHRRGLDGPRAPDAVPNRLPRVRYHRPASLPLKWFLEAREIIDGLRADGFLTDAPFDEPIEFTWFDY